MSKHLIEVKDLKQHFPIKTGWLSKTMLKAVDGVSFQIDEGETLGLVGESGCGKTTVGRSLIHLYTPTAGEVLFDGHPVNRQNVHLYRRNMQMVFQDPYSSLNPRMTVSDIIGEALDIHRLFRTKAERRERVEELMLLVGLNADHARRYAHEFSGGQRQRIGIARALAVNPKFIVCDEPVSALDVSIQAQIIALLQELKREMGLTYLFISHDISVIGYLSDRVAVMYLGEIVETGPVAAVLDSPRHPYTQSLLSAVPDLGGGRSRARVRLQGDLPSPLNPPKGCKFHTRCPLAVDACRTLVPQTQGLGAGHSAACHRLDEGLNLLEGAR